MAKTTNNKKGFTPNKLMGFVLVGGAGYLLYEGIKYLTQPDKSDKDYDKLRKKAFMKTPEEYAKSRSSSTGHFCVTRGTDWGKALEDIRSEVDPSWYWFGYTNQEKLLGYIKEYIKTKMDFAYFSYLYQQNYREDFPSLLENQIDALTDDIAFEHLNYYLLNMPDTNVLSCRCESDYQKGVRNDIFDLSNGQLTKQQIRQDQYC